MALPGPGPPASNAVTAVAAVKGEGLLTKHVFSSLRCGNDLLRMHRVRPVQAGRGPAVAGRIRPVTFLLQDPSFISAVLQGYGIEGKRGRGDVAIALQSAAWISGCYIVFTSA